MALRYFDRNGTTAGFGTLTGAWDTTTASWTDSAAGTATPAAFTFTSADEAQFGATGATGTAGTATIAASLNVTLNKVRTQNLATQTIAAGTGGALTLAGTAPTIDLQSTASTTGMTISAPLNGTGGFTKSGIGLLTLTGACNISGALTLSEGQIDLALNTSGTPNMLANITSITLGDGASLRYLGSTAYTEDAELIAEGPGSLIATRNNSGISFTHSSVATFSGNFALQPGSVNAGPDMSFSFFPNQLNQFQVGTGAAAGDATTSTFTFLHSATGITSASLGLWSANAATSQNVVLNDNGTFPSVFAGNVTNYTPVGSSASNTSAGFLLQLNGTNSSSTFSGNIGISRGLLFLAKSGTGKWALSGTNTYTGTTTISAGTLSAQNASALGRDSSLSGSAISVTGGTLELSGGITLDKSGLNISTVTTASPTNAFQVPASGGDNTLEVGSITLNSTIRVEVGASGALRLANTGAISGSTFGITKEGSGELDLNAAANTYTGAVAVNAGTLTVSASCAPSTAGPLGNASSAVTVTGTLKFDGASNSNVSRSVQLTGSAPALDASGTHHVHFSNVSQASGTRTLTLKGTSTATNQLQSALANGSGGTLSLTKEGAGQWQVTGTPTYTGATTVNAGTLDFGGQTLSLSGGVAMAGGTLANGNIGDTLVTAVTFTGGTVIALLDSTSTVTATSGTGRLQPLTADGSNSYTGNTTVQSGATLELVTDSNPGTVGDGKVTGASNVTVSGTLATGSGVNQRGQARYGGNLTFAAGSVLAIGAAA
jgi:autotransporter-associated beta strand protein